MKQVITWIIAILCSGLAGALFNNWYANRSTVVEYSINRTILGTDQTTVVPNLRIQVGNTSLQALYIYTIKLQYSSGPELEDAKVGIGLLTPDVKQIGSTVVERPGEAFSFDCLPFEARAKSVGSTCAVRRFGNHVGAYTVAFATTADAHVEVSVDAKNTEVRQAAIPGTSDSLRGFYLFLEAIVTSMITLAVAALSTAFIKRPKRT